LFLCVLLTFLHDSFLVQSLGMFFPKYLKLIISWPFVELQLKFQNKEIKKTNSEKFGIDFWIEWIENNTSWSCFSLFEFQIQSKFWNGVSRTNHFECILNLFKDVGWSVLICFYQSFISLHKMKTRETLQIHNQIMEKSLELC
jgi:hypothetical protein